MTSGAVQVEKPSDLLNRECSKKESQLPRGGFHRVVGATVVRAGSAALVGLVIGPGRCGGGLQGGRRDGRDRGCWRVGRRRCWYRCVSDGDMPAELLRWGDPQLMMEKKRVSVPVVPLVRLRRQVQKGCSPAVVG